MGQLFAMRIALFEPEIAGNVGAVLRLGACFGAAVDLIEPLGFVWDDRRVRRAAMDYIDHVTVARHSDYTAFRTANGGRRLILLTTKSSQSLYDFEFMGNDVLLFGKESAGVPAAIAVVAQCSVQSNAGEYPPHKIAPAIHGTSAPPWATVQG